MGGRLTFVLGGARSGKSTWAQEWAAAQAGPVLFVATAQAFDDEMRSRIARHQAERPPTWRTLEQSLDVGAALLSNPPVEPVVVIDCLTLLISNILLALPEDVAQADVNGAVLAETEALLTAQRSSAANWLIVSNEVGMGIVPPTRLGRYYRDALGYANQHMARGAHEVLLLVAGLPWRLKTDN
jgi:adenosylcobinamide kinase/adenosylcobinamide-phosphate guanylyltransferase